MVLQFPQILMSNKKPETTLAKVREINEMREGYYLEMQKGKMDPNVERNYFHNLTHYFPEIAESYEKLTCELELQKQQRKRDEMNLDYADRHNKVLHKYFMDSMYKLDEFDFNTEKQSRQLKSLLTSKFVRASDAILELCRLQMELPTK